MFIGREKELKELRSFYDNSDSGVAVLYGRRRIGKSRLIKEAFKNREVFLFEGLEGEDTPTQIINFKNQLSDQVKDTQFLSDTEFKTWHSLFSFFTKSILRKKKTVLVFDELQWMAARRTKLISLIKYFWDNHWKEKKVILILCGSIASFMIEKVVNSKALYGRISLEIRLDRLLPHEIAEFLPKRSSEEVLLYALTLGGIPKYLEEVRQNRSFDVNINRLCFQKSSLMLKEFEKIFYSQFREATSYLKIIRVMSKGPATFDQISQGSKITSGGGLRSYLKNLIEANFIGTKNVFEKGPKSKKLKYYISDQFLSFYFKFIEPNSALIGQNSEINLFQKLVKSNWESWMGYAFEKYCYQHADIIANKFGFLGEVEEISSLYEKNGSGFQVDLIFKRFDKVIVVSEIKCLNVEVSTSVIPEMERKLSLLNVPRGYSVEKALVSLYGESKSLQNARYFDYSLTLEEFLSR